MDGARALCKNTLTLVEMTFMFAEVAARCGSVCHFSVRLPVILDFRVVTKPAAIVDGQHAGTP